MAREDEIVRSGDKITRGEVEDSKTRSGEEIAKSGMG